MAIYDGDRAFIDKRLHGPSIVVVDPDSYKALPGLARGQSFCAERAQCCRRDRKQALDLTDSDGGLEQGRGVGDDWNQLKMPNRSLRVSFKVYEIFGSQLLGLKDPVEPGERKPGRAVEELRYMRSSEAGLVGKQGDGEIATLDSAQQLRT